MAAADRKQGLIEWALVAWLAIVVTVSGGVLFRATTDPHGLSASPAIHPGDLPRVEPLYGAAWTEDGAIAWSPDERWVALSTRTTTFIAQTGTRRVVRQIAVGGDALAWTS